MRKGLIFFYVSSIILSVLINISAAYAKEKTLSILSTYKKDINGDQQAERIQIKKNPQKNKTDSIEITIISGQNNIYKVPFKGEYEPSLSFIDYNENRITDMLLINVDNLSPEFHLISFENEEVNEIPLPEPLILNAQYINDYKASIQHNDSGKVYMIDLYERKNDFEEKGLYHKGLLNEPTELKVYSFDKLKPVTLNNGTTGLEGSQAVGEEFGDEIFAQVDSTWKWVNGKWILLKMDVRKLKNKQ